MRFGERSRGGFKVARSSSRRTCVEWEKIWRPRQGSNVLPSALEGLRFVRSIFASLHAMTYFREQDVHTITTLTDSALQGRYLLNSLSRSLEQRFVLKLALVRLIHAFCDGEVVYANLQWLCNLLRSCQHRTFRWLTPNLANGVSRPTCDYPAT